MSDTIIRERAGGVLTLTRIRPLTRLPAGPTSTTDELENGLNSGMTHDVNRSVELQACQQNFATLNAGRVEGREVFAARRTPAFTGS
ncbi:MAG: hypothetical protein WEB13_10215 [Dehalococcoidia bacterium]